MGQRSDEFWCEVDTVLPHDCVGYDIKIFKKLNVGEGANNIPVVVLNGILKINNGRKTIVEFDANFVIRNVFRFQDV